MTDSFLLPSDITLLRDTPLDLYRLEMTIRDFYLNIPTDLFGIGYSIPELFLECENNLNFSIILVWSIFNTNNSYIGEESYDKCEEDLGRIKKNIDKSKKSIINMSSDEKLDYLVISHMALLNETILSLCFFPFKNIKKYNNLDEFVGFLFLEFSSAVSYLGGLTSEQVVSQPKFPSEIRLKPSKESEEHEKTFNKPLTKDETTDTDKLKLAEEFFKDEGGEDEFQEGE